ncbi:MAG: hypothetical protein ACTS73_00470 [Arsenophonus sp. NEOnobi-MAG3]
MTITSIGEVHILSQHMAFNLSFNGGGYELPGSITDEFMQEITGNICFLGYLYRKLSMAYDLSLVELIYEINQAG